MNSFFLKAKHWQLFSLTTGIPLLLYVIFMITVFSKVVENPDNANPFEIFNYFKWFPLIMLFVLFFHFGWIWSIGYGLQKYIPANIKMNIKRFKIFFFIPIAYIMLFTTFINLTFFNLENNFSNPENSFLSYFPFAMIFIIPLHLFSIFCLFYNLYFCSKTLKTIELQREVSFGDCIGEFFLMWFHFIGIWILQPRINKIVAATKEN